jgi:hypothetical protein
MERKIVRAMLMSSCHVFVAGAAFKDFVFASSSLPVMPAGTF